MNSHADDGLLVSILSYLMAVLTGLALFIGPVLWANGPTIKENIAPGKVRELSASRYSESKFPVAKLKHKELVNPTHLVELNARVKKTAKFTPVTARARPRAARTKSTVRANC